MEISRKDLTSMYGGEHTWPMKRTTIWLRAIQVRELKLVAKETGARIAALIRVAIDQFIERRRKAGKKEK